MGNQETYRNAQLIPTLEFEKLSEIEEHMEHSRNDTKKTFTSYPGIRTITAHDEHLNRFYKKFLILFPAKNLVIILTGFNTKVGNVEKFQIRTTATLSVPLMKIINQEQSRLMGKKPPIRLYSIKINKEISWRKLWKRQPTSVIKHQTPL